jgi:acyl-CoA thioesterase I
MVLALAAGLMMAVSSLAAQETGNKPAQAQATTPATTPSGHPADAYWTARDKQLLTDFGWLARFKDANANLPAPAPGENRVVFMGDSITEGWHFDQFFPGKPYINRGISGQTTPQMLVRFRQDVIDLHPKVVVILAGTNDIAGNTGPMTAEQTQGNLQSMAELAKVSGIRVILCSIPPSSRFSWAPNVKPADTIIAINAWIKAYAASKGFEFVDYHSAMKDAENGLPSNLSKDGVHPLPAGYAVMTPLVEAAIARTLNSVK